MHNKTRTTRSSPLTIQPPPTHTHIDNNPGRVIPLETVKALWNTSDPLALFNTDRLNTSVRCVSSTSQLSLPLSLSRTHTPRMASIFQQHTSFPPNNPSRHDT